MEAPMHREPVAIRDYLVVPSTKAHMAGFRAALDSVAREGRFLASNQAPSLAKVRAFVEVLLKEGGPHLVALHGRQVVGWCDVRLKAASFLKHSGVLGMGVVREHRGRGLGRELLARTLEICDAKGLSRIELQVRIDNGPAIALYRRAGFEAEGIAKRYLLIDGIPYDALLMARLKP
jgi:ribosomal protein S18 acetylase RimI-like enzyme